MSERRVRRLIHGGSRAALTLSPMMCSKLLRHQADQGWFGRFVDRAFDGVRRAYARRLQIQENLTTQIAESLMRCLEPSGVAVVVEAKHLCMMMRGVEKQNSVMKTSCLLGVFKEDARTRSEFLSLLQE